MPSDYTLSCFHSMLPFVIMIIGISWMAIIIILAIFIHPFAGIFFSFLSLFCIPPAHLLFANGCGRFCERTSLPLHSQTQQAPSAVALQLRRMHHSSLLVRRTIQNDDLPVTCVICLDDVQVDEEAAGSPNKDCIHEFHPDCISEALMTKTTCPSCAREFLVPDCL